MGRNHDELWGALQSLELVEHIHAVHFWHFHITKDQINLFFLDFLKAFYSVLGFNDLVLFVFKDLAERSPNKTFVIDN